MAWGSSFDKPTDRLESYKLTDPVPLDGEKLQPKFGWPVHIGVDLASEPSVTVYSVIDQNGNTQNLSESEFKKWAEAAATEGKLMLDKWPSEPPSVANSGTVINAIYQASREHTNKVPTHDPYTNPNAQIYYECKCGQILDPGTKRFAELNNCASNAGWKIRFSDSGYTPYCVECGKGVE